MFIWILLLALAIIAYLLLMTWVLPKSILKSKYPLSLPTDRGLKKYKFSGTDYAVVYEPSITARKYITQYVLAKRDGNKTFKCKIANGISYIDFDIVLFNAQGKSFLVVNSMSILNGTNLSEEIDLPSETAYASIIINQVDEIVLRKAHSARVTKKRLFGFGILAFLTSIAMSVFSMLAFSNIFAGVLRETFAEKMLLSGWILFIPSIICAVCIIGACSTLSLKNSRR